MSGYNRIGYFLRREPRPATLRTDSGQVIAVATSATWIRDTKSTIEGLTWERLEALDANGTLLRAIQNEEEEEPDAQGQPNPESLAAIAELLERAADKSAGRYENAYTIAFNAVNAAFERYGQLVEVLSNRMVGLETVWAKSMNERARLLEALATKPEEEDDLMGLVKTFVQAKAQGPSVAKPPAKPNGGKA